VEDRGLGRKRSALDPDDEALLTRLGDMFDEDDGPPATTVELAKQSYGLRTLDAELAALTADSDVDAADVVLRQDDPGDARLLSFQAADLAVELEVTGAGRHRHLFGQILPAGPVRIALHQPSSPDARWIDVDDRGRFMIENVSTGPIRLTCHRQGQPPVVTQWTWLEDVV
jgi:hypothetical protein